MAGKLSKKEFYDILQNPDMPKAPVLGKADWDAILQELKKVTEPLPISTIHEEYVKGVVTRFRTKNVVQRWAAQGKCKQIWYKGQYWFLFEEIKGSRKSRKPKEPKAPKEPERIED